MTRPILVVVDLQKDFIAPPTQHLPALIEQLTARYKAVIATRCINEPGSLFETEVGFHKCMRGTPGAELAFRPAAPLTVIDKGGYGLIDVLDETCRVLDREGVRKGDEIHLCGVDTDACVLKIALDFFDLRYRPRILLDACASGNGADYHDRAIEIFTRQLGNKAILRVPTEARSG